MQSFLPAAAAAATGFLVGASMVATRFVIDQTDPVSLALLRYLVGFLCLLPPLLMARRVRFARRDLLPVGLLGIFQFGVLVALLNFGLQTIPSARGALIFATFPLLTLLFSALLRYEPLTLFKLGGVLFTILGVGLALGGKLLSSGTVEGTTTSSWIGELAVFGSALCGALCSVLYRPYLERYPVLQVSAFAMLASVVFLALLAAGEGFFHGLPDFSLGGWLAVLFIGVSSGLGYYFWLWALRHTTPTKVAIFLALSPLTAAALGALLLAEDVSLLFLLGLACVAFGLWLAYRPARAAGPP